MLRGSDPCPDPPTPKSPLVQTWLALALQTRRDEVRDDADLRARDRAVARTLPDCGRGARARIEAWLEAVLTAEDRETIRRVDGGLRALRLLLSVIGLVAGMGTAAVVFYYDGSQPINVLPALAVFVVLPLLTLLAFLISALPPGILRRVPGSAGLQQSLLALGSAFAGALLRLLPQRVRDALTQAFGAGRAHQRLFGRVQKWLLLGALQRMAVAFHVGAILWFAARVFVTDLGFTWSATAEAVTPDRVHAFVQALAWPWHAWAPDAVPSLRDVAATQFFRLGSGVVGDAPTGAADPALLAKWWKFLLAAMITYGLFPRVLASILSAWRLHAAAHWTIDHAPAARDALDRMTAPAVHTRAREDERTVPEREAPVDDGAADTHAAGHAVVVVWSAASDDRARLTAAISRRFEVEVDARLHAAGAGRSTDDDRRAIDEVAADVDADSLIVLVVKSWEPATMDALDFVRALRRRVGDGPRIVVAGLRLDGEGDEDVEQWRLRMKTLGDPWLRTVALDLESGANR